MGKGNFTRAHPGLEKQWVKPLGSYLVGGPSTDTRFYLSGSAWILGLGLWRVSQLTELQALARSTLERLLTSVLNTFIFSTKVVRAVSVASPTFS